MRCISHHVPVCRHHQLQVNILHHGVAGAHAQNRVDMASEHALARVKILKSYWVAMFVVDDRFNMGFALLKHVQVGVATRAVLSSLRMISIHAVLVLEGGAYKCLGGISWTYNHVIIRLLLSQKGFGASNSLR